MRKFSYLRACLALTMLTTGHIHAMEETLELPTAARKNLIPELLQLLKTPGADVNKPGPEGFTALHWAARNGHLEVVAILLAHKANPTITTPEGETAAQFAEEKRHDAIVSLLLKHQQGYESGRDASVELLPTESSELSKLQAVAGGNFEYEEVLSPAELARARKDKNRINQPDAHGLTPLHYAVTANDANKTRQLVSRGAHIDARRVKIGTKTPLLVSFFGESFKAPLHTALAEDNSEMTELLLALGANVELRDVFTPLCWAAYRDRVALAKILIKAGADLQTEGYMHPWGGSAYCALRLAHQGGERPAMVQFLTEQGATFGKSKSRRFFMHFKEAEGIVLKAVTEHNNATVEKVLRLDGIGKEEIERRDKFGQTPLLLAAECCLEEIALTLIGFKADITAQDDEGGTALHYAVSEGIQTRLIEVLITAEANVNAQNKHGETALHVAAQRKVTDDKKVAKERLRLVKLLLKKADLKRVDEQGRTALHYAVEANNLPLVKLLAKTTPSVPDHKGQTPLLLANSLQFADIAKLLAKKK